MDVGQIISDLLKNPDTQLVFATLFLSFATLIGAIISAVVVWVTAKSSEKTKREQFELEKKQWEHQLRLEKEQHDEQFKQSEEQHQVQGLLKAFELLDDNNHRKARKRIFFFFFEYRKNGNIKVFANSEVEQVIADFDVLGRLVRSKNISENDFLNVYGSLVYRCWRVLEKYIIEERKSRDFDQFMDNFEWLAKKGYNYWKDKGYDINKTRLYNPEKPEESVDFQENFWRS